jgi:hypothetical protein
MARLPASHQLQLDLSAKVSVGADRLLEVYHNTVRWAVPKKEYRELKLRIHGKTGGEDITPLTLPLSRLAEYLADFASLLGYKEHVHFLRLDEGSAAPLAIVEMEKDPFVRERIKNAAHGFGPTDAVGAYGRINSRLTEDDGYGEILEMLAGREVGVIEFPGKKRHVSPIYGPIRESAFVQGELKRVGGQEPTIPIHVVDADQKWYHCWTKKAIAQDLAPYLFQQVRLYGIATWQRNEDAIWDLQDFEVQSYTAPLGSESPSSAFAELRAVPSEWKTLDDPLRELRRIRHGEDDVQ